jgi:hypothetical protein
MALGLATRTIASPQQAAAGGVVTTVTSWLFFFDTFVTFKGGKGNAVTNFPFAEFREGTTQASSL